MTGFVSSALFLIASPYLDEYAVLEEGYFGLFMKFAALGMFFLWGYAVFRATQLWGIVSDAIGEEAVEELVEKAKKEKVKVEK